MCREIEKINLDYLSYSIFLKKNVESLALFSRLFPIFLFLILQNFSAWVEGREEDPPGDLRHGTRGPKVNFSLPLLPLMSDFILNDDDDDNLRGNGSLFC